MNFVSLVLASFAFLHSGGPRPADPVLFEDDIAKAFTNSADVIASLVSRDVPPPHLLATYRKLGVKVYARYGYQEGVDPEFVRRACGFLPFVQEADGVWLEDYDQFPAEWKAAVEAAKADVAAAEKLKALGTSKVGWWFEAVDFARVPCDLLRKTCLAYAAAGDVPGSLPVEPRLEDPDYCDLPTQKVERVWTTSDDFIRTRLELKTKDRKTVFYDLEIDTRPVHPGPRAPSLVTDKLMVTVGFRFRPWYEKGYGLQYPRVRFAPQYRTFTPAYPKPVFKVDVKTLSDGRREVRLQASVYEKRPVRTEASDGFEVDLTEKNPLEDFDL